MYFKTMISLVGLMMALLAWNTQHTDAQDATCNAIQVEASTAQPGDMVGITGLPDDLTQVDVRWIESASGSERATVVIYADATLATIPDLYAATEDEAEEANRPLAVLMPLHPDLDPAGGAGVLDVKINGAPCIRMNLTMAPITFAYDDPKAELDEILTQLAAIRQQTAELNGIDRDLLADMDAATLPAELQAMQGYDRIYDYLLSLLDGTAPDWMDENGNNIYDPATVRYVLAVGDTLGMLRSIAESIDTYEPLPDDMGLFSLTTQPVEVVSLQGMYPPQQTYMQVDVTNMSVEQVAFYMRRANHARRQLNGQVGGLINNAGIASVAAGLDDSLTVLGPAGRVIGVATFFAKSEIEMRKFMSGPERFLSLNFEADPLEFENEDDTTTGVWFQVEAVVARDPWNITPKIYDTARLFPGIAEAGGLAGAALDVLGNTSANPLEQLPAIEIGEKTWRVNLSQRLSGNYAETLRYITPRVIPMNGRAIQLNPDAAEYTPYLAGRSRLIIQVNAPIFGNPPGGNTQTFRIITVNEMAFNVTSANLGPFNPGDEVCVSGTEMENINDEGLSWQASGQGVNKTDTTSEAGESFCMTIPSTLENNNTWNVTTCSAPSDEVYRYTIEATSTATDGARNPDHGPQPRTDSFEFDVRIASDDPRPEGCEPADAPEEIIAPLNEQAAWHASGFGSAPMCNNLILVNNLQDLIIEVYPNEVVRIDAPIELYFDGGSSLPSRMRPIANYHGDPAITLNVTNGISDKTMPFLANRLNDEWQNFIWHQWRFARIPGESWLIARYEQYQVWESGTVCTGYTAYILTPGVGRPDDLTPYINQAVGQNFFQPDSDDGE